MNQPCLPTNMGGDLSLLSIQGCHKFRDLMDLIVSTLNLPVVPVEEPSQPVFNILCAITVSRIFLPILDGLLKLGKSVWFLTASCPPFSRKVNKLFQTTFEVFSYFHTHLVCSSLVVAVASNRARSGQTESAPADKEGRIRSTWGKKCSFPCPSLVGW